jgi:carboxypeptidase PM20D1
MTRFVGRAAAVLALLLAVAIGRALLMIPAPKSAPAADLIEVDATAAAARLAGAIRIPTVSQGDRSQIDYSQWGRLHAYLEKTFPRVHATLGREIVGGHSLLYTWTGADASAKPVLMLAHQDVVPVEPGTEGLWPQPPFSGAIADGHVWGRGALDDKGSLVAQLDAVEALLARGFAPRRTIYFAFGHDEEIGGQEGAKAIAALLAQRGVMAEFSLDEGGTLTTGVVAGIDGWVASVMTAEKGYLSLQLTARDEGGHSSRPPQASAIGRVARAVSRLEQEPFPTRLVPPVTDMLDRLAPAMRPGLRLAMANRWLFGGMIRRRLAGSPVTAALIRTTTAPTIFQSGVKDNVLPAEASATVNFRILPGETMASVEAHVRQRIQDPAVQLSRLPFASEPSPVADPGTPAFAAIERTINEVYPDATVAPGLSIGATDNRHYGGVREARYNFAPARLTREDLGRIHGASERIGVADHARAVQFYARFLVNVAGS